MSAAVQTRLRREIRYVISENYFWLWSEAPFAWSGRVDLRYTRAALRRLQPSGSWTDPVIVDAYVRRIECGRAIAPLVVCATESGSLYIHDGNHRYRALQIHFGDKQDVPVRIALAEPHPGYRFRFRQFDSYSTYLLEPALGMPEPASPLILQPIFRRGPVGPVAPAARRKLHENSPRTYDPVER